LKIIFHNPHKIWFKNTISGLKNKSRCVHKYDYLFDYFIQSKYHIYSYLDSSHPSKVFDGIFRFFNSNYLEYTLWIKYNNIPKPRISVLPNLNNLNNDDILLSFTYGHFNYVDINYIKMADDIAMVFKNSNCKKVFHLSHFGYNTRIASQYCNISNATALVCESNLKKNSKLFNSFFDWYGKDIIQLPYIPADRFQNYKSFDERKNIALATGTITYPIDDQGFRKIHHDGILQPIRNKIFENKEKVSSYIDCYITDIRDYGKTIKDRKQKSNNIFIKLLQLIPYTIRDINILYKIYFTRKKENKKKSSLSGERDYYKLDIVQTYNNCKMFVCPEEIIGIPGIGFVEGMACGSAYIGLNSSIYKDYGMIDKQHYIAYDGTLDDLVNKISYYQKNQTELEEIANNGYGFVKKYFNPENVASNFIKTLERLPD